MLLATSTTSKFFTKEWEPSNKTLSGSVRAQPVKNIIATPDEDKELESSGTSLRLKEMLKKVEMTVSSYDTAWVAMVPSLEHSRRKKPLFPNSLKWVMENQQPDGSWSFDTHPLLIKDALSSTLASVLALQTWNVAQQLIHKGLEYIGSNIWAATDMHQYSPSEFNVIFPSMLEHANKMGLSLSIDHSLFQSMLRKRDLEITSLKGRNLAYVAEGLKGSNNWKEVMKYQRRNGSILNSPASTAAALIQLHDVKCCEYLDSLMAKFQNAVPTLYPFDIYARLCILDELEKLGVDRFVEKEKIMLLDDIYRCWLEASEEIFEDPTCCAMAFRFLRMNGYVVSPDVLENFEEENMFHVKDTKSVLELFKASQLKVSEDEGILDRIYSWATSYLNHQLLNGSISDKTLQNEVDYVVKHPHAILRRIENRNYIENYNTENVSLHKTSFRFLNVDKRSDLLALSRQDFNTCQIQFKKELAYLARWEKKYGLDKLKYARQRLEVVYFSIASNLFEPEFCDARLAWTQNAILSTVVDDFFEYAASSMEQLLNLINLIQRWDGHASEEFKSKEVEILFYAIYDLVNEDAEKAKKYQERCIKRHLIDIWIDILKAMLKESEYVRYNIVPTIDEYTSNGCTSISFGAILLIPLYFLGKMSEEVVTSQEYQNLYMHISILGRLLNDRVTSQKDMAQGKLNSVSLRVLHSNGTITEEEAKAQVDKIIEKHRRELLRMVVQTEGSVVPKECKKLFWMTSKVLHLFYMTEDCFSSPTKLVSGVKATLKDPFLMP